MIVTSKRNFIAVDTFFFRSAKTFRICKSAIGPLYKHTQLLVNYKLEMCSILDQFTSGFT